MWEIIAAVLASASPHVSESSLFKGMWFGPPQRLVCQWFTNFENSRFDQCKTLKGIVLFSEDGASIECLGQTCKELEDAARKAVRWNKPEPVWGTFRVEIVGRVSNASHKKRYLGDGTRTVLIEQIVSVQERK